MSGDDPDESGDRDPFAELEAEVTEQDDESDPFAGLDAAANDDAAAPDDAFESVDVGPVDAEDVWASLEGDEERPEVSLENSAESLDGDDHRVPKQEYCERCPFFADPPEVACTHEGTSIVAVEDAEQFRVRNCPMVEGVPPGDDR
ncbi:MAG: hypothetical protein ABEJ43_05260 [Haloferacaceae archaeon]